LGQELVGRGLILAPLAQEIAEDLKVTLEPFRAIADSLGAEVLTDKDQ
jgi:hypothetical protein